MEYLKNLQILWDYLSLHRQPEKADVIVGFGCFDTSVAIRAAELYREGYAPKVLFTGGLGRNTTGLFSEPEAVRFAKIAMDHGVPAEDTLLEDKSGNTRENIEFTRALLETRGIPHGRILGVHKHYMERRIWAAMGVYWPDQPFCVTSPQMTLEEHLAYAKTLGMNEHETVSTIVGDLQRMEIYAKLGYQLPQEIPEKVWDAYHSLVKQGFDTQLVK